MRCCSLLHHPLVPCLPALWLDCMPVSPPPGQLVLCFHSPSALKLKLCFTSHFKLYFHLTLKYVITIILQENRGEYQTAKWRDGSKRTLIICLNSVGSQPGSLFCIPCFLHRQPELITSECTPWNDGWALATGLSGEGAGPYGSGIWKLIAEDRAKGGE